ncbi:High mobility group B protein 15 [Ancistrocladus abbreviatus]
MVEQGKTNEGGGGKMAVTSSFGGNQSPFPSKVASSIYHQYPPPLAKYEDVVANRRLFMDTLEKLHAAMGTKFMIPIIGGRDLDLHQLFVEVTSRGGIEKILREKRWKEVTAAFSFPSTATNASFVLRKYYYSLLNHYEQIYYFKAHGWTPLPPGSLQGSPIMPVAVHGLASVQGITPPQQVHTGITQQPKINTMESMPGASSAASSVGCPVVGVIDGKFDSGYLVTVTVGTEKLKGVLYQAPADPIRQVLPQNTGVFANQDDSNLLATATQRRRRRKKSEIRKRDPALPKPNRSGYNFFFAEQHARLKPLYSGKDREISRMIGELWTNLKDSDKAVYQEKALKDKERYRIEMEDYRERLRSGRVISDAVPIQQRPPGMDVDMVEVDVKDETGRDSTESPENESDSSVSETEDDRTADKDESESCSETPLDTDNVELTKMNDKPGEESIESSGQKGGVSEKRKQDSVPEAENQNSFTPMT